MPHEFTGFTKVFLPQIWVTQNYTSEYLNTHNAETLLSVTNAYASYSTLLALPTGFRLPSQSYYPYNFPFYEALEELNSSVVLAFSGEYKSAIQHLRFFLELSYLGIYMMKPVPERWLQEWLIGNEKTPAISHILRDIENRDRFKAINSFTGINLRTECYKVYDELSGYVHTRGYFALGTIIRGSNFPMLNPDALGVWVNLLHSTARVVALAMLGQFPQALQRLPLYDKFGFAQVPRGGFLEPFEVDAIERSFEADLLPMLRKYSDQYHAETLPVNWEKLDQVSDLPLDDLKVTFHQYWEILKKADRGNIPDKTWLANFVTPEDSDETSTLGNAQTPAEFVRIATSIVRQMNAGDESVLAQAYTINLLKGKGLPIYKG